MRLIFATFGLTPSNMRLMPWRYILEISKELELAGSTVTVVSGGSADRSELFADTVSIRSITGAFKSDSLQYRRLIDEFKPDAIFVPVSRRLVLFQNVEIINGIPHFAYFPSPWYHLGQTRKILGKLPIRDAIVYGIESIIPGKWFVKKLRRQDVRGIVTITEYTASQFVKNNWPKSMIKAILPGIDSLSDSDDSPFVFDKYIPAIAGRKYLLYMGPARTVRGIYFIMEAFDAVADNLNHVAMVCLIRESTETELATLRGVAKRLKNKDSFVIVEDRLARSDVAAFIRTSHAVTLPFLLIPSEIPLAVMEAMSLGKPVITTETGGTSAFVGKAGIVVPQNDIESLAAGIKMVFQDDGAYKNMCSEASAIIAKQQPWSARARQLYDFTTNLLSQKTLTG